MKTGRSREVIEDRDGTGRVMLKAREISFEEYREKQSGY